MTTVREMGEIGLIDQLARMVAEARLQSPDVPGFRLRLGIGDDAAAWDIGAGVMVSTTDTMVEGVHFIPATTPWSDAGWKVMAANLSDLAAMGAAPLCAMVTLGLPSQLALSAVEELYEGMLEACTRYRLLLVGGDIVDTPHFFVTVALSGACAEVPLTRASARPGDALAVTGPLGGSAGGLRLLESGAELGSEWAQALMRAHRRPTPRVEEGQRLLHAGVRCAMDVSDGLVTDLTKMCRASGVGARLDAVRVPVDPALARTASGDALQLALNGGEEYELLFAGTSALIERMVTELGRGAVVGEVTASNPGRVSVVDGEGQELSLSAGGWEHLRR